VHLNYQDLKRILNSSYDQLTNITDDTERVESVTDDTERIKSVRDDTERVKWVTDDTERVKSVTDDSEQVESLTDDTERVKSVTDPIDVDPVAEYPPGLCETCIHTKQQQKVIRTKASGTTIPFELVHSDLYGPMKHSIGGAQYYIIYIDDCTRYTEVYFLVTKTVEEISANFRHY
jgi:hypothetical protein